VKLTNTRACPRTFGRAGPNDVKPWRKTCGAFRRSSEYVARMEDFLDPMPGAPIPSAGVCSTKGGATHRRGPSAHPCQAVHSHRSDYGYRRNGKSISCVLRDCIVPAQGQKSLKRRACNIRPMHGATERRLASATMNFRFRIKIVARTSRPSISRCRDHRSRGCAG